jgi:ABC-type uncharacterized transport system substrate-binding protein
MCFTLRIPDEVEPVRSDACLPHRSSRIVRQTKQLVERAKNRLPRIDEDLEVAEASRLLSDGTMLVDLDRRAPDFIGSILQGTKSADLPVEQPTKFELLITLKPAREPGLTIPLALLFQAAWVSRWG